MLDVQCGAWRDEPNADAEEMAMQAILKQPMIFEQNPIDSEEPFEDEEDQELDLGEEHVVGIEGETARAEEKGLLMKKSKEEEGLEHQNSTKGPDHGDNIGRLIDVESSDFIKGTKKA